MMDTRIVLQNTSRWYGEVIGLNDVTCAIGPGMTALLGMNGAGKSTMMKLITGQILPTTGSIRVYGQEPFANPEVYRSIGYCPEIDNFYEHWSGRRFVYHMARLSGMGHAQAKRQGESMLEMVGMADRADRALQGYSKGMRQRIKLAQAMVHDPDIILLDEPLNGLDPLARHEYIGLLGHLAKQGKTILVSSHILFEVEQMTHSILLMHRGRLLASGDLRVIRDLMDRHPHRVSIETDHRHELAGRLAQEDYVLSITFNRDGLEMETREPDRFYDELPSLVRASGATIHRLHSPDNNLESIFRYLVSEAL